MALDVPPPDPPDLTGPATDPDEYADADVAGDDYRREELDRFLRDGAWATAFERWASDCRIDRAEWAVVTDLGLVREFDFFWDGFAGRVGYHAPGIPEDWKEREIHPDLDSWGAVSSINAGLTELGQVVCDVLAEEYVDWDDDYDPPEDLPDL